MTNTNNAPDLGSYDKFIVAFSGGKDSTACFLHLLEMGVPTSKIEIFHHKIDGDGPVFMDWESTDSYCKAFASAFDVPIYFSWKVGGFRGEMLRENALTAPTAFETPDGLKITGGKAGKLSTRRQFPQISPDLSVRWCSAYLKIDICKAAIRNQDRFNHSRTLVISGERGEESAARSRYAIFEPDAADNRNQASKRRHVDRWRPIRDWTETEVWAIIERHKVRPHPAYFLGFGRVSCKFCIFGNADQFASAYRLSPAQGDVLIDLETQFGKTMKRDKTLVELIASGKPYDMESDVAEIAVSDGFGLSIFVTEWVLPKGAFSGGCGPS